MQEDCVLFEEPASSSFMSLNKDGGAVFLRQPDGSTQLVLLTPDQQQKVSEACALKESIRDPKSYYVSISSTIVPYWQTTDRIFATP